MDYKKLEDMLKNEVNGSFFKSIEEDLPAFVTSTRIFLWQSLFHHKKYMYYEQRVEIDRSILFVKSALKEIDPKYLDLFITLESNIKEVGKPCIKFQAQSLDFPRQNGLDENNNIIINYYNTIEDAFVIMDEFFKYLMKSDDYSLLNALGKKTLSFTASLYLEDYISRQDFFNTEFRNYKFNILKASYESASYLLFIYKLIELYISKEEQGLAFDENILEEIKASEDPSSIFYRILNDDIYLMSRNLIKFGKLNMESFTKDLIVPLISFKLYEENLNDKTAFVYLVDLLSNSNASISYMDNVKNKYLTNHNFKREILIKANNLLEEAVKSFNFK